MSTTEPTRPEDLEKVVGDEAAAAAVREADLRNGEPGATDGGTPDGDASPDLPSTPNLPPGGTDTRTGTDPDATYDQPGYEDKSLGQAVQQDRELADRLLDEAGGDEGVAAQRFEEQSAGRTTRDRQRADGTGAE